MPKLRPRSNGQPEPQRAWEENDAQDKLAEKLADDPAPLPVDYVPTLPPMPQQPVQRATQPPQKAGPKSDPQALLDTIVVAVLEERIGVIEQGDKVYLTEWIQNDNVITLRTLGTLGLGGRTVIRGSNVSK